jgi:hypothetical protein
MAFTALLAVLGTAQAAAPDQATAFSCRNELMTNTIVEGTFPSWTSLFSFGCLLIVDVKFWLRCTVASNTTVGIDISRAS